jgi:hypothetical protein
MDSKDAAEPERKDATVELKTIDGGVATAIQPEVKVELDRIARILDEVKGNTEAIKTNTETLEGLVGWTVKGIVITIILSAAAIVVSFVH